MRPLSALRRALGRAHGDVAVEVRGREQELRGCAVRQVGDGGCGDIAAPAILNRHGDTQRDAEVARLARLGQTAKLARS